MIHDHIANAGFYKGLGPGLAAGLEFLEKSDLKSLALGRHEIQGESVFALVQEYTPKPLSDGKWEAHRRFIDLQFLVEGRERIGFAFARSMAESEPYSEEKDVLFLKGRGCFLTLKPGFFVVLGPDDAHMPGIAAGKPAGVRKVVVKVRV